MIIEQRTYTLYPGKVPEFLNLFETEAQETQTRVLGNLVGYFTTEFGPLNQVIHMWGYESLDERTRRRAELFTIESWVAYTRKISPLLMKQESIILVPTAFSPIR